MKPFFLPLIPFLLASCSTLPMATTLAKSLPTVIRVDGADTLTLDVEGRTVAAEIACIDAQMGGEAAMHRLRELLPPGQAVQTRIVDDQRDRTSVELFLGNESVGLMLVREGFAAVDPATIGDCAATQPLLQQAQDNAQQAQLGIWGVSLFDPTAQTTIRPNTWFEVTAASGNCPETVGLWAFMLGFEGGADHTVVADTQAIATLPAQVLHSEDRRIIYEAPLQAEFAGCSATAESDTLSMYAFHFGNGKVRFEVDLTTGDGFREIRYADVAANRPYVFWRAAE